MSAAFNGTSQYLSNPAAPIVTYPFSVGFWFCPLATGNSGVLFGLSDTATTNNNFSIRRENVGDLISITTQGGGSTILTSTAVADPVGKWAYIVGRFISATNRRLSIMHSDGSIEHIQSVTSASPTGVDTLTKGAILTTTASRFFNGLIAESWSTNTDIQPGGAQLDSETLRQLAFHGPFSLPTVVPDLVEYHQMRRALPSQPDIQEDYFGKFGIQPWVNVAGVSGPAREHPPLPYEYDRPQPVARTMPI